MQCPFCNPDKVIIENSLTYAIYDRYPVNPGHFLIITKRHVESYFDTSNEERVAINQLIEECKKLLDVEYFPDGYNIGVNCGKAAGQTIFHVHVHLIPRFSGDIEDPRGGVRGVIPGKRIYE
ncbi:MAG: HIT family protein [Syntrophomonadaceae bacterium]|mgnify:CR=1 FL=1|nr:HIT family protein [Syntrophomonadaceae bacterium]